MIREKFAVWRMLQHLRGILRNYPKPSEWLIGQKMALRDSADAKLLLFWTSQFPCPFHALSSNILREVCLYISQNQAFVLDLSSGLIKLYDLNTRTVTVKNTHFSSLKEAAYCLLESSKILVAGGADMYKGCWVYHGDSFLIENWEVRQLPRMIVYRSCSGIYAWQGVGYVFGGLFFPRKIYRSCEKYAGEKWLRLPNMNQERHSFTPVLHDKELYLPSLSPPSLESFSFATECFRSLPLDLPLEKCGSSVSFLAEDKSLVILAQSGHYYVFKEGSGMLAMQGKFSRCSKEVVKSLSPVLRKGREVYFRGEYRVLRFNIDTKRVSPVDDFTEVLIS